MQRAQVSITMGKPALRLLKAFGKHYRWTRSQGISECVLFCGRLFKCVQERFRVVLDFAGDDGGSDIYRVHVIGFDDSEVPISERFESREAYLQARMEILESFIREVSLGMVSGFRDPLPLVDFEADDQGNGKE